jgi:hypothetical protein
MPMRAQPVTELAAVVAAATAAAAVAAAAAEMVPFPDLEATVVQRA